MKILEFQRKHSLGAAIILLLKQILWKLELNNFLLYNTQIIFFISK